MYDDLVSAGIVIALIGFGMAGIGRGWFRRSGVRYWTFTPIWRTHQELMPAGTVLTLVGFLISVIGVVLTVVCARLSY